MSDAGKTPVERREIPSAVKTTKADAPPAERCSDAKGREKKIEPQSNMTSTVKTGMGEKVVSRTQSHITTSTATRKESELATATTTSSTHPQENPRERKRISKLYGAQGELAIQRILKIRKDASFNSYVQEQQTVAKLSMELEKIDEDVRKIRRKVGGNPLEALLGKDYWLLAMFLLGVIMAGAGSLYADITEPQPASRTFHALLRIASEGEGLNEEYPLCENAIVTPWRNIPLELVARDIKASARLRNCDKLNNAINGTSSNATYVYGRTVVIELEAGEPLPQITHCPPSIVLLPHSL